MKIYICEQGAIVERESFLSRNVESKEISEAEIKRGDGFGRFGTLSVDVEGDTGVMYIVGHLNNEGPSFIDAIYGYSVTGYDDILSGIDFLVDVGVRKIIFKINSPGGLVGKVDQVWEKISTLGIDTVAEIDSVCCSGGYYIASACKSIVATNPNATIGSIGVAVYGYDASRYFKNIGIEPVDVVSDNAPKKALGLDSADGIAAYKEMVNSTERRFIGRISEGRGIDSDYIRQNFGRGGVMNAMDYDRSGNMVDALSVGMIDSLVGIEQYNTPILRNGEGLMSIENSSVDIEKISAEENRKATVKAVSAMLKISSIPSEIRNCGIDVISGNRDASEFYSMLEKYEAKVSKNESVNVEVESKPVAVSEEEKKETKPGVINSIESLLAHRSDFRR